MEQDAPNLNGFFSNLFGVIAGTTVYNKFPSNISFGPADKNGNQIRFRNPTASWLGLKMPLMQKYAYEYCFPLASVVDRMAEADITGNVEILRVEGKGKENFATNDWSKRMRKLLAQPNPMQSWEQFRAQQLVYKRVFGFCPVFPICPAGFESDPSSATTMINLPPWLFEPVSTNKMLYQTKISGIVKEYKITLLNDTFTLKPEQVMILEDSFHQDDDRSFMVPKSRLVGLDMAVSNICRAMEADNVLLTKRGPLGLISKDNAPDAVAGQLPLLPDDKSELQNDLRNYGIGWDQYQYVISSVPLKWVPMSFDSKQLGTKETVIAGSRAICQRFGFPFVLFEDSDATYSNQESAHKKFYDNNIIPNNRRDLNKYNQFFKAAEENCKITADFTHLSVFQEDELNRGRARAYNDQGLEIEYLNDIITKNQWLIALGLDTVTDGELYYSQTEAAKAKLAASAEAKKGKVKDEIQFENK